MDSTSGSSLDSEGNQRYAASRFNFFFAVCAAYTLHISTGAVMAWPSPMIPRLNLTTEENSLLSSLFSLGAAPGNIIAGLCLDSLGRKGTLYVISSAFVASWILLLVSSNIFCMYLSRLIGGMGIGGTFAGVSVYIAEICDEKTRGPLSSLVQTFMALGLLAEYVIGPSVSYSVLAIVSLAVTMLFVVLFYFVPESPHYLVAKGKTKDAFSSILWLRGDIPESKIHQEIDEIQEILKSEKENVTGIRKLLTSASVYRGIGITCFLIMMQQGSGMNAVLAYVQFIFDNSGLHLGSEVVPVLVGITNLVASLPTPILVRRFGNKAVVMFSSICSGICLCLLSLYFYLLDNSYDVSAIGFLPVASVILFNVFFCLGIGPLVWGIAAGLFSPSVKGMAIGLCGIFSAVFGFLAIQIFSNILHVYGFTTIFLIFGVYLIICGMVTYILIPDTSRMTLQEIQEFLEGNPNNKIRKHSTRL